MTNVVQKGDFIQAVIANTVHGGDLVKVGNVVGVAITDGDGVNLTAVATKGVYRLAGKNTSLAVSQGDKLYVTAGGEINKTDVSNTFIGFAWEAAGAADDEVVVGLANGL